MPKINSYSNVFVNHDEYLYKTLPLSEYEREDRMMFDALIDVTDEDILKFISSYVDEIKRDNLYRDFDPTKKESIFYVKLIDDQETFTGLDLRSALKQAMQAMSHYDDIESMRELRHLLRSEAL